jgi:hypothetical protein
MASNLFKLPKLPTIFEVDDLRYQPQGVPIVHEYGVAVSNCPQSLGTTALKHWQTSNSLDTSTPANSEHAYYVNKADMAAIERQIKRNST